MPEDKTDPQHIKEWTAYQKRLKDQLAKKPDKFFRQVYEARLESVENLLRNARV